MSAIKEFEISDIKTDDQSKFKLVAKCTECGAFMAETDPMTGKQMSARWVSLVMGGALSIGRCPKCDYSTFSDCNMGYETVIVSETEKAGKPTKGKSKPMGKK